MRTATQSSNQQTAKKPVVSEEIELHDEVIVDAAMTPEADPPVESVSKSVPKVFVGPCPTNPAHTKTRIYSTKGMVRYACCDDCGATWKQTGPEAGAR